MPQSQSRDRALLVGVLSAALAAAIAWPLMYLLKFPADEFQRGLATIFAALFVGTFVFARLRRRDAAAAQPR